MSPFLKTFAAGVLDRSSRMGAFHSFGDSTLRSAVRSAPGNRLGPQENICPAIPSRTDADPCSARRRFWPAQPLPLAAPTTEMRDPPAARWHRLHRPQRQRRPRRPSTQRPLCPSISRRAERSTYWVGTPGPAHPRHQRSNFAGTPRTTNTRCWHRSTPIGAASRPCRIFDLAARHVITTSSGAGEQSSSFRCYCLHRPIVRRRMDTSAMPESGRSLPRAPTSPSE